MDAGLLKYSVIVPVAIGLCISSYDDIKRSDVSGLAYFMLFIALAVSIVLHAHDITTYAVYGFANAGVILTVSILSEFMGVYRVGFHDFFVMIIMSFVMINDGVDLLTSIAYIVAVCTVLLFARVTGRSKYSVPFMPVFTGVYIAIVLASLQF